MPQDKLLDFYNALSNNPNITGLPKDYNTFKSVLDNEDNSKKFFDMISQNENVKGLPSDYDTFAGSLGLKKKGATTPPSETGGTLGDSETPYTENKQTLVPSDGGYREATEEEAAAIQPTPAAKPISPVKARAVKSWEQPFVEEQKVEKQSAKAPEPKKNFATLKVSEFSNELDNLVDNPNVKSYLERVRMGETGTTGRSSTGLKNKKSTAKGDYQFLDTTRNEVADKYGVDALSQDPRERDKAAVAVIHYLGDINSVLKGDFKSADTRNSKIWTSLPGGSQPNVNTEKLKQYGSLKSAEEKQPSAKPTTTEEKEFVGPVAPTSPYAPKIKPERVTVRQNEVTSNDEGVFTKTEDGIIFTPKEEIDMSYQPKMVDIFAAPQIGEGGEQGGERPEIYGLGDITGESVTKEEAKKAREQTADRIYTVQELKGARPTNSKQDMPQEAINAAVRKSILDAGLSSDLFEWGNPNSTSNLGTYINTLKLQGFTDKQIQDAFEANQDLDDGFHINLSGQSYKEPADEGYFQGTFTEFNKAFSDKVIGGLDKTAKVVSDLTGLDYGGNFAKAKNLFDQYFVEGQTQLPEGSIGSSILKMGADLAPDLMMAALMPETKLALLEKATAGTISHVPKFSIIMGTENFLNEYDAAKGGVGAKLWAGFKGGAEGAKEGLLLEMLGVSHKAISNALVPIYGEVQSKIAGTVTNAGIFGLYDAANQLIQNGKIDDNQLAAAIALPGFMGLPEIAGAMYNKAVSNWMTTPNNDLTRQYYSKAKLDVKALRERAMKMAGSESAEDKVAAQTLNNIADNIVISNNIIFNSAPYIAQIEQQIKDGTLTPEEGKYYTDKINQFVAENDPRIQKVKPITDEINTIDQHIKVVEQNNYLDDATKQIQIDALNEKKKALTESVKAEMQAQPQTIDTIVDVGKEEAAPTMEWTGEEVEFKPKAEEAKPAEEVKEETPEKTFEQKVEETAKVLENKDLKNVGVIDYNAKRLSLEEREKEDKPIIEDKTPIGTFAKNSMGDSYQLQDVEIKDLTPKESGQNLDLVEKYLNWKKEGNDFPPITAIRKNDGSLIIVDGHNRYRAAKLNGDKTIKVWVGLNEGNAPKSINKAISEAYHADKEAGKETDLTKTVEDLIGKPEAKPAEEVVAEAKAEFKGDELTKKEYTPRNKNSEIVFVSPDKILEQHAKDEPDFDIQKKENQIGNRIEKAKDFLKNYLLDDRAINPKTGERIKSKVSFEASIANINENGKLGFTDGRHRILAAKELGLTEVPVEVPKEQVELFKSKFGTETKPEATAEAPKVEAPVVEKVEAKVEPVEPKEGDRVELPPANKYATANRVMEFKDGEWQMKVGREYTKVSEKFKQDAAAKWNEQNKPAVEVKEKVEPKEDVIKEEKIRLFNGRNKVVTEVEKTYEKVKVFEGDILSAVKEDAEKGVEEAIDILKNKNLDKFARANEYVYNKYKGKYDALKFENKGREGGEVPTEYFDLNEKRFYSTNKAHAKLYSLADRSKKYTLTEAKSAEEVEAKVTPTEEAKAEVEIPKMEGEPAEKPVVENEKFVPKTENISKFTALDNLSKELESKKSEAGKEKVQQRMSKEMEKMTDYQKYVEQNSDWIIDQLKKDKILESPCK